MGNIGEEKKRIILIPMPDDVPIEEPMPAEEPAVAEPVPA